MFELSSTYTTVLKENKLKAFDVSWTMMSLRTLLSSPPRRRLLSPRALLIKYIVLSQYVYKKKCINNEFDKIENIKVILDVNINNICMKKVATL